MRCSSTELDGKRCTNIAVQAGLCKRHGAKVAQRKICTAEDCTHSCEGGSMCETWSKIETTVYGLCQRHGAKVRLCTVAGCNKQVQKGGVCTKHYGDAPAQVTVRVDTSPPIDAAADAPALQICLPLSFRRLFPKTKYRLSHRRSVRIHPLQQKRRNINCLRLFLHQRRRKLERSVNVLSKGVKIRRVREARGSRET